MSLGTWVMVMGNSLGPEFSQKMLIPLDFLLARLYNVEINHANCIMHVSTQRENNNTWGHV